MKEGWGNKTLGEVCKIYNGNSINADYKKKHFLGANEGLPFIATKDVSPLGTIDYKNGVRIPNYEEYKVAPANSVFICAEGGSAGKKFAYVEKDVCFGNKLFCITPKDKSITGKFVYHFVQSDNFRGQFFSLLTGLIGGVSAKKFQTIEIPVPPLSEQQSIVDYLDSAFAKIDAMKANAEKALNEAKALFQASLKEMLEPKEGWEEKTIGDILNLRRGHDLTHSQMSGSNYPVAGSNGQIGTHNSCTPISPCITVGRSGSVGAVNIYKECWAHNTTLYIDDFKGNYPQYLYYLLKSIDLLHLNSGSAVPTLNRNFIHPIIVPYIKDIVAQQTIVATLDALKSKVDRLKANYEKISKECDALKQALLKEVFEG